MNIKQISPILLTGLVVVIGVGGYFLYQENKPSQTATVSTLGADLAYREGGVQFRTQQSDWQVANQGQNLKQGDSVRIVGAGKAILALDDGSAVRLNADTTVILEKLTADAITIRNDSGEVYTRVVPMKRTFSVVTSSATYTSLGTAYTTLNKDDSKGVRVFESQVQLSTGGTDVTVPEGKQYFLDKKVLADISTADISGDGFVAWNKSQDQEVAEYRSKLGSLTKLIPDPTPTPTATPTATPTPVTTPTATPAVVHSITLTGKVVDSSIKLSWTLKNLDAPKGFKLVKSESKNPVYPGSDYQYLDNKDTRTYTWDIHDGKTYHFRVCIYTGDGCSTYSNDITVAAPSNDTASSLSILVGGTNSLIKWSLKGGLSAQGYKVVWSKNSHPTYPTRSGDQYIYLSEPTASQTTISAFDGAGKYYVRVCEYLGGACGVYSNQLEVNLTE